MKIKCVSQGHTYPKDDGANTTIRRCLDCHKKQVRILGVWYDAPKPVKPRQAKIVAPEQECMF